MLYHPDKHNNDVYATARFNEIKEAYETLTNPAAKEMYLQQRWLKKAAGLWMPDEPITPPMILKQALELNKSISLMDVHRMDTEHVAARILQLIPDEVIEKLKSFREEEINATILTVLLQSTSVLPFSTTQKVTDQLRKLAEGKEEEHKKIERVLQQKKKSEQWQRYKIILIITAVIAICLLIYFAGRT